MSNVWAVFLDRDGTLNKNVGLVTQPDQLHLIPGVALALQELRDAGALLLLVTNQPVVARELVDEPGLLRIHQRLTDLLEHEGIKLDGIYYCPHHPETHHPEAANPQYRRECDCRKPQPGMLLRAAEDFGIELGASYMIGDSTRDVAAAEAAGCHPVLLRTGAAGQDGVCPEAQPEYTAADMSSAVRWVLEHRVAA